MIINNKIESYNKIIELNLNKFPKQLFHSNEAVSFPDYNLKTNTYHKTLNKIPCFDDIYSYIIKHHLKNIIVEFAFFNKEIGIKKENIII